ncbi:MAG: metallophosphoesterase, partial [Clostridiales bacterium]|nr:metallophosphoesterase [Clostridiales bacterium]
ISGVMFFPLTGKKHVEIWSAGQIFDLAEIPTVEKREGEAFRILQLSDIQTWSIASDNRAAYALIERLVEETRPDLIVTVGDNVSGATTRFLLKKLVSVLDSFEIPWTVVYGNHDDEIPMTTLNWQSDQIMAAEYSLFQKGPSNLYGSGNHVINVTENGVPVQTLFFLDNGRYIEYGDGSVQEVYMGYEQMAWYRWNVEGIARSTGGVVPSMVFSHFAMPEFRDALEQLADYDADSGIYTVPEAYGFGEAAYLPSTAPVNSGFFDLCRELGSTNYLFCGHDHENNASITYAGITMTYGQKTGPSPRPWNDAKAYGGTLITIGNADMDYAVEITHVVPE